MLHFNSEINQILGDIAMTSQFCQITRSVTEFILNFGVDVNRVDQEHHHVNAAMSE